MDDIQVQLIAEQLNRIKDNTDARLKRLETSLEHYQALDREKLDFIRAEISKLKDDLKDHETRLRTMDDTVISFKTTATIMQAGQAALTLIAASLAAWLGGQR
jgi:hypothetical protein